MCDNFRIRKKNIRNKKFKLKKKLKNTIKSSTWVDVELARYKLRMHKYRTIDNRQRKYKKSVNKRVVILAPIYIDYYFNNGKNLGDTNKFIDELKDCILRAGRRVFIDFSNTEQISAAAMLSFLAEVDVLTKKSLFGANAVSFSHPKDEKVESILKQVGFYDLLKKESRETKEYEDVTFWKYTSGSCSEPFLANDMIQGIKRGLEITNGKKLYRGFIEAMSNSVEHAYLDDNEHSEIEQTAKWWTFAGIKNNKLTVVICDKGVGIPLTLPKTQGVSQLEAFFASIKESLYGVKDSSYIKAAAMLARTRTGESNRGKGFTDITSVIDNIGVGTLSIFSNKGRYIYTGKKGAIRDLVRDYKSSVCGTIVEWTIPFEAEQK